MDDYTKHEVYELVWLVVYVVLIMGIATLFVGLSLGGFERENILQKTIFYTPYGIIFLMGLIALKIAGIFVFGKKHADVEGVTIHDPAQSPMPKLKIIKNPFLLGFFCIIVFGILGWVASKYQTFFSALPDYQQQFTKGADLFFAIYPASTAETLGALFLISLLGFILGYMVMKQKLGKVWFLVLFFIMGPLISMAYGIINHIARYSGSEVAMANVAAFWLIGGVITVISGSIIPFLLLHDINNFFYKFSQLFSSEIVTITTFLVLGMMTVLFLIVLFKKSKRKKHEIS